jgi:lipopolysaccharide transport system permease protein
MRGGRFLRLPPALVPISWARVPCVTNPTSIDNALPVKVIRAGRGWRSLGAREVWRYRELLVFLTWRNILVRYKQTVLGLAWAMLQPFFLMIVFTVAFGRLAKIPSDGVPYPVFSYAALLPWTFFANSLTQASNSLVGSANLLSKIYFPRLTIPISAVLSALVDFFAAFAILVVLMVYYSVYPRPIALVVVPGLLLLVITTALGVGLWLSALCVRFRDVQYITPFLAQVWLFATPVVYPASLVTGAWHTVLGINPMAGVVEGFRWSLLGSGPSPGWMLLISTLVAIALLVSGAAYFRRAERTFADVV